ncbi:MAG: hypothetical protein JNN30_14995 [Rhodanobacteraceae bacterium]|nr:hypothetical protein [Rhodanobacteraceae bacterium]
MAKVMGAALVGLISIVASGIAGAAVPAVPCNNCSGAQEEQVALSTPGLGIRFVYDLQGNSIRKFKVYLDVPTSIVLDAIPVEPQPTIDARVNTPSGVAVRTLWEMSVDPDVVAIFNEMKALNATYPNAFSKQFRIDITNLGLTYGDVAPRYFDPQSIGWDYPSGEGFRFMDRVNDMLGGANSASTVDGRLSRLIHGILRPATGAYIEGGTGGATGGVQFGSIGSEFTVDFCSSDGSCTRVKISVTTNGVKSEYVGSRDKWDVQYPSGTETNIRRYWGRNGFEYARDMAAFVANRSGGDYRIEGGGPVCTRVLLACTDNGATMLCTVYCQH